MNRRSLIQIQINILGHHKSVNKKHKSEFFFSTYIITDRKLYKSVNDNTKHERMCVLKLRTQ